MIDESTFFWLCAGLVTSGYLIGHFYYRQKVKDTSFRCPWCNNWHFVYPSRKDPDSNLANDILRRNGGA